MADNTLNAISAIAAMAAEIAIETLKGCEEKPVAVVKERLAVAESAMRIVTAAQEQIATASTRLVFNPPAAKPAGTSKRS